MKVAPHTWGEIQRILVSKGCPKQFPLVQSILESGIPRILEFKGLEVTFQKINFEISNVQTENPICL